MAFDLNKLIKPSSSSWTDFYYNMTAGSLIPTMSNVKQSVLQDEMEKSFEAAGVSGDIAKFGFSQISNFQYADRITTEYDKAIQGGKTILGGVPIKIGNTAAMRAVLFTIMLKTSQDPKGDLLRDIGPAIQAYWVGAQTDKMAVPNIPCVGALKNINTIFGVNLSPGVWTPLPVPAVGSVDPFLLSFIASASLHLLTVGGIITCNCQYPPPAPPAPGILPWGGYFVKPFTGTQNSMKPALNDLKTLGKAAALNIGKPLLGDALTAIFNEDSNALENITKELKNNNKG
jgi:hypothetical protein